MKRAFEYINALTLKFRQTASQCIHKECSTTDTCRLHGRGIEVILDVVYNHTVEGSDVNSYCISHRLIDAKTYYMMDDKQYVQLLNYSGCGNTVSANAPATLRQIVDSLKHWVEEYHVDGFRFDLATALCRGANSTPVQ